VDHHLARSQLKAVVEMAGVELYLRLSIGSYHYSNIDEKELSHQVRDRLRALGKAIERPEAVEAGKTILVCRRLAACTKV
jgi:hypothetical protein